MKAKQKYRLKYALHLVVLFVSLFLTAWFFIKGQYTVAFLLLLFSIWQSYIFYNKALLPFKELDDFASAVRYRDFSRHFNAGNAPAELQALRQDFNTINQAFKSITREKETQHQYLQKILELVQTGILLYETGNHKVLWANESLKKITQMPYIPALHLLERKNAALYNAIVSLEPGSSNVLLLDSEQLKIMLSATAFHTEGKNYKLVALQNINEALDENEARSWKKLLSVMTHEIMNSVAPISSLAGTLKQRLADEYPGIGEDIHIGIDTIQRRSDGLLKFTAIYRNLNKISSAGKKQVLLADLFEHVLQLLAPRIQHIEINVILKNPHIQVAIDQGLIEQVLINLFLNAIDALKDTVNPTISLSAYPDNDGRIIISVHDNGPGITDEIREKIFIPFFSTKKNGSGIGLSLCKQIMLLHKGNIFVRSIAGKGTSFLLHF
ncbi:MAG: HAMP domain-containing sensor histidine kinase [Niabella sp.]